MASEELMGIVIDFTLCRTCARLRGILRSRDHECYACWRSRWETRRRLGVNIGAILAVLCAMVGVALGSCTGP